MHNNQNNPANAEMQHTSSLHPIAETYIAPQIEIIDIELEQNILGGSGLPGYDPWEP